MRYLYLIIVLIIVCSCERMTKEYYDNGNLKAEYSLNDSNQFHGKFKGYYENGNIRAVIEFEEGQRIGTGVFYDSTGVLSSKELYKNGLVDNYKQYNKDGKITYDFTYLDTLNLPSFNKFNIRFSHRQDTFTVGDTTMIEIACDLVSKSNIEVRMSNGITRYDREKQTFSFSFEPKSEGRTFMMIWLVADDETDKKYFIGKKEYPIKN